MQPIEDVEVQVSVPTKRYRTNVGDPTCANHFPEGRVCDFLITDGSIGYCVMLGGREGPVIKRERGTHEIGYLIPHKDCPLWSDAQ